MVIRSSLNHNIGRECKTYLFPSILMMLIVEKPNYPEIHGIGKPQKPWVKLLKTVMRAMLFVQRGAKPVYLKKTSRVSV